MPAKRKPTYARRAKRRTDVKSSYKRRKAALPRNKIRTTPGSLPNTYAFKRAYSYPVSVGVADVTNHVYLNTDSTVCIVQLHTKFNKMPDWQDFQTLFSEYKITSIRHRLVPFYKNNIPYSGDASNFFNAIPNYEVFALPVAHSVRHELLTNMTGDQFNDFVNQSQRKSQRVMPSGIKTYWTKYPKVTGYSGPIDKAGGNAMMTMQNPGYLSTDPSPLVLGGMDQTDVAHYGIVICFRRVDGLALSPHNHSSGHGGHMGFRMETDVYFRTRKVQ